MRKKLKEKVRVRLGKRSYDIVIGSGIMEGLGGALKKFGFTGVALISNPTVHAFYGGIAEASLKASGLNPVSVTVPDGEEYKSLLWMELIWGELLKRKLDRKAAVVALGGGVIGDMAGFAASAYMRGIAYIQVPTTLLAQVDSSVGGKTGVNHPLGKNMIGAFYQPSLVWIDIETLKTLPRRELLAGTAEVVKYGVIWERAFFDYLKEKKDGFLNLNPDILMHVIKRSCEIKAEVVSKDERESGLRAILNYGHTIGHAVETATGYKRFLHGEAVAIGMCEEARLSAAMGVMNETETLRIIELAEGFGLPSRIPSDIGRDRILEAMTLDKKALAGDLRFTLPEKIGSTRINERVQKETVARLLGRIR